MALNLINAPYLVKKINNRECIMIAFVGFDCLVENEELRLKLWLPPDPLGIDKQMQENKP